MSAFSGVITLNKPYVLSVESYHGQIITGPDYNLLNNFVLRLSQMLLPLIYLLRFVLVYIGFINVIIPH